MIIIIKNIKQLLMYAKYIFIRDLVRNLVKKLRDSVISS